MNNETFPEIQNIKPGELRLKGFKVYEIGKGPNLSKMYNRKDFYKVCLVSGKSIVNYADRGIEMNGSTLFFGTPYIPYSWEIITTHQTGFSCLFSEDFLKTAERSESIQHSPLFKIGGTPIFNLNKTQRDYVAGIFKKMTEEQDTDYIYKDDLIRNYINLLIHEALKLEPPDKFYQHNNASSRIASLFLELLERQFPIEDPKHPLALRAAQDYADRLSIHVNHLNRSVKEVTGKSTTTLISERIASEAKALLRHTGWNIADIAYGLGFEYPTYFNNYFKRITGTTPKSIRA